MTGEDDPVATASTTHRRHYYGAMVALVVAVVALDQATKSWAVDALADRSIHLFWTVRLDLSFNSGLAFSQGEGLTGLITIVGVVLVAGLVWWARGVTSPVLSCGLALLIGGASGNLADRVFRGHDGSVIDFIDVQWWPVFNVADIAVTFGALILVVSSLREPTAASAQP